MRGTVVIGEGERDEAPMLYIGERVGTWGDEDPEVDIAVDPLEGTNLCATGAPNAIAVLAAANKGGLLHAPDCYMEKIIVGPAAKGAIHLDAPVAENLSAIANRLERSVKDPVVIVLDRPRHEQLIEDIRRAGARIRLISDGDLSAGIAWSSDVDGPLGTGAAVAPVLSVGPHTITAAVTDSGSLVAQATIRSVCRQRNAGIWSTSSTWAAGTTSETACTSDSTARPVSSFTFWRMRRPSVSPGPR